MIIRRLTLAGVGAAGLMAAFASLSPVLAQRLPFDLPPLIPTEPLSSYDLPNVPDERGCVKKCFRDDSPCDPPLYKKNDNRCGAID